MFTIEELPPLEDRVVHHPFHIRDNYAKKGKFEMVRGPKNTFLIRTYGNQITVSTPFENEVEDDLVALVEFLREIEPTVNLWGFENNIFDRYRLQIGVRGSQSITRRLYQNPLTAEAYDKKLRRFRKSGFEYRQLGEEDIPAIHELMKIWVKEKTAAALRTMPERDIKNKNDALMLGQDYINIAQELGHLEGKVDDEEEIGEIMERTLTTYHGALRDGELLAYIRTEGNDSYQEFETRANRRMNSHSPQEFLDLTIARMFASRGVPLFNRGVVNFRSGFAGLLKYKMKFGRLFGVKDENLNDVVLFEGETYEMLHKLFDDQA